MARLGGFHMPRWRLWLGVLALVGGAIVLLMPMISRVKDEWQQRQMIAGFDAERRQEEPAAAVNAPPEASSPAPEPAPDSPPDSEPGPASNPVADPGAAKPSPVVGTASPASGAQQGAGALTPLPIRLEIPVLDLSYMVMQGIEDEQLRQGPGHYPQTPLPGAGGNAAFAGHRTIQGRPAYFYHLDKVKQGDQIRVILPDQVLTYVVERVFLTSPYDIGVLGATGAETLTLTTCDPPGLDDRRLIVRATLHAST